MTRPDVSFDVNNISSEIKNATVKTVKEMNKIISKVKARKDVLRFQPLGKFTDLRVKVYTDASFGNQDSQTRSTGGKVILVEDSESRKANVISWKTKKIPRVCRSVKAAETRALEDGLDDAINTARIFREVYSVSINLKEPAQIPVFGYTDCKSLWESLHSTKQCEEKLLRNSIASMKELLELGLVSEIQWVSTKHQLADCMTKKGNKASNCQ